MANLSTIQVRICLAYPERQLILQARIPTGTTTMQLLSQYSDRLAAFDPQWQSYDVAIFGQKVQLQRLLQEGDQVELLRALLVDPKLARQRRVEVKRRQQMHSAWRRNSKSQRVRIDYR